MDGLIEIEVIAGKDLPIGDINGLSDPYCLITLPTGLKFRTKTIYKNLNPVWNEKIICKINRQFAPNSDIEFTIYDADLLKSDDYLGILKISLNVFENGQILNGWYMVSSNDLKCSPELHIIIKYTPPTSKYNHEEPPAVVYCEQKELIVHPQPFVSLHPVSFDGYLLKRSDLSLTNEWKHRYCAIIDSTLCVFDSTQDKSPQRRINLSQYKLEEKLENLKTNSDILSKSNCFVLQDNEQVYYFAALTKVDYDRWIKILRN